MEKEIIKSMKVIVTYTVPATAIVLAQIYYHKKFIWPLQTFSLFFGSIFSGVMFTEVLKVGLEIMFPDFMLSYWVRLEYIIVATSTLVWFFLIISLFMKWKIFDLFDKLEKWK